MNIQKATREYEAWLAARTTLVEADLQYKHTQMALGAFPFLRATFYRWAQIFPKLCPALVDAPTLLTVGDLHIANFGTWRDAEGRLVWGINDFDEAHALPYANDLVRLAASAALAECLHCAANASCAAILEGYGAGLAAGGKPFVLAEDHVWLRDVARRQLADPQAFWTKMDSLPTVFGDASEDASGDVPASAREGIEHALPRPRPVYRVARRRAGLGSLGHPRFVGLADWAGGKVAREAKALVPSAALWAEQSHGPHEILYQAILTQAVRCRDPFVELRGQWVLRRLAPDCTRVPLESLNDEKDELRLLRAMGWETANVHLGAPAMVIRAVRRDLARRPPDWLLEAMQTMTEAVEHEWKAWKKNLEEKQ